MQRIVLLLFAVILAGCDTSEPLQVDVGIAWVETEVGELVSFEGVPFQYRACEWGIEIQAIGDGYGEVLGGTAWDSLDGDTYAFDAADFLLWFGSDRIRPGSVLRAPFRSGGNYFGRATSFEARMTFNVRLPSGESRAFGVTIPCDL